MGPAHVPVLPDEVREALAPALHRTDARLLDCTTGLGGHARILMNFAGTDACYVGMDADEGNLTLAKQNLAPDFGGRVRFFHANFAHVAEVLAEVAWPDGADAVLADLGFASTQVDEASRGLSFQAAGPLDMRLDQSEGQTAADLVNRLDERDLADLIYRYGEERLSRRIARGIVAARAESPIETTDRLAEIIRQSVPPPARRGRIHPATRTFQALRIAVNDELGALDTLLASLPGLVRPGGRVAIISFHSLEDRPVKRAFAKYVETGQARFVTKKPVTPSAAEVETNPRSRSAKLRAIEWTAGHMERPGQA